MNRNRFSGWSLASALPLLGFLSACTDETAVGVTPQPLGNTFSCSIPQDLIVSGGPGKDGIPALTNPEFVIPSDKGADYLRPEDRVVGLILDSEPVALPLNIFWWHEIVNLDGPGFGMAITHCPLTGSSVGFDRIASGGAEFGVSGLLYQNNLIMYDRNATESLWPQMSLGARCGPRNGTELPTVPILEMTWEGWQTLHPDTKVVSADNGMNRPYTVYPYGNYDEPDNARILFPAPVDPRRPPKERVLGIPNGSGGVAFPFGVLDELGAMAVASVDFPGGSFVVFWDRSRQAAMAYTTTMDGRRLTFSTEDGRIVDDETGSSWRVDGLATEGPLAGRRIRPISNAFVAFWFAWPLFFPDIEIWDGS